MLARSILLAAFLALLPPAPAGAQSIYRDGPVFPGRPATPPSQPAAPAPQAPATPTMLQPKLATPPAAVAGPQAKPGQPQKIPRQPGPVPPGSVIAPPGSIVLPPASVAPPRTGADTNRRVKGITLCNQRQISCNRGCNSRTMGAARTLCYQQCSSIFQSCTTRANSLP